MGNWMNLLVRSGFAAVIAVVLVVANAAALGPQHFSLAGHGQLQMVVPASWQSEERARSDPLPPTITFKPESGAPFLVLLTPVWPIGDMKTLPRLDGIHEQVAAAAQRLAPQSVEQTLSLRDFAGASGRGYYFIATDRAPNPGEFKYLAQGIVNVGDINLAFTVLTNDGQDAVVHAALDMIRGVTHRGG